MLLKQMYENFNAPSTESLDSIFNSLQKIVSQLAILGENISQEDLNMKFLKSFPAEWNTHVVVWRNKTYLDTMIFDDLYNNFKIIKQEVKRTVTSSSSSRSQNMAFLSSPGSTNEVDTANIQVSIVNTPVSTVSTHDNTANLSDAISFAEMKARRYFQRTGKKIIINGSNTAGYDKTNVLIKATWLMMKFQPTWLLWLSQTHRIDFNKSEFDLATYKKGQHSIEEQLVFYKKNEVVFCDQIVVFKRDASFKESKIIALKLQLEKLKKEKESNQIKTDNFENASKSLDKLIRSQLTYKSKTGLGFTSYNVVAPPPTGLFAPLTIDLSNSGLKKFQHPDFESYGPKASKSVCVDTSNEIKKASDAPIIEDLVSDCDEDESEVMVVKSKNVQHKPEQVNQPRKVNQNPRNNIINWNEMRTQKLGVRFQFTKKACFVCGSFSHLIKDYDFHDKKMRAGFGDPKLKYKIMSPKTVDHTFGDPQDALKDTGIFDSGCSRHMTGNKSYLIDYQEYDGGFVAFAGSSKGGQITSKCKIRTGKLDFKYVYFMKELKFNLSGISQMCDKKNSILFTETECLILSLDFMLPDKSQVLLKVPRKNNMYSFDLKNVVPSKEGKAAQSLLAHIISFMRPFGCPVTILNTLDHLGKFDGKADEGFLVAYSINSKSFRVYNSRTEKVEENPHVNFLENKPSVARSGLEYLFDIDSLTNSINYQPVSAEKRTNGNAGSEIHSDAGQEGKEKAPDQEYILLPLLNTSSDVASSHEEFMSSPKDDAGKKSIAKPTCVEGGKSDDLGSLDQQMKSTDDSKNTNSTNSFNTASRTINTSSDKDETIQRTYGEWNFSTPITVNATGSSRPSILKSSISSLETPMRKGIELKGYLLNDGYADLVQHVGDCVNTADKSEDNSKFHQIVDFLSSCSITYALTISPTIYASYIEQFWNTASSKTINYVKQIHAIVDGKAVVISESLVRSDLLFDDEDVITCLTNDEIFENLTLMGYEPLSTKFTFQKDSKKFLMYPRFLQLFLNNQLQDLPENFNDTYETTCHTKKVFSNMAKKNVYFSKKVTPLFDIMLVQNQAPEGEEGHTSGSGEGRLEENVKLTDTVPTPYDSPLLRGYTPGSDEGRITLAELMEIYTTLLNRVTQLENELLTTKAIYNKAFITLTNRVKKLESQLKKTRSSLVIHSSDKKGPSVHIEDSPKQRRIIEEMDKDKHNLVKTLLNIKRSATKDKGKGIMQETELPKKLKKKEMIQLSLDKELAQKLYAEELAKEGAR
uniref:Ribonuclease H-like domain-containing protein n=1 Tax=Tanacetum cinerariifolium TaxID=118510 RepID=A0A6L2NMG4_TANCI|nr:ribonuclease H-like domain-containing protein [Tanacetum cinerariifolium]